MIYFIVNNDFHVDILKSLLVDLSNFDLSVISIPYNLNKGVGDLSNNVINVNSPYVDRKKFVNPFLFLSAKMKVKKINFNSNDVVILLTEYDPMNLYVTYLARNKGAKTILLEEGIATYYNNVAQYKEEFDFSVFIKLFYMRFIIGFNFIGIQKINDLSFFRMKDDYFNKMILFRDVILKRNIQQEVINARFPTYSGLKQKYCIFLNQPIYQHYLTSDEYLREMEVVISQISIQFEVVYFKFHPRDLKIMKDKVVEILSDFSNVIIVPYELDIFEAVNEFKPLFAISFFSDALFKLSFSGLNVVFLYHLFPKLKTHPVLKRLSQVLELIKYTPVSSFSTIVENEYSERKSPFRKSINDIISELI